MTTAEIFPNPHWTTLLCDKLPPETLQVAQCAGKDEFESYGQAKGIARKTQRNKNALIEPYKCEFCGKYHIGSRYIRASHKMRVVKRK